MFKQTIVILYEAQRELPGLGKAHGYTVVEKWPWQSWSDRVIVAMKLVTVDIIPVGYQMPVVTEIIKL